MLYTLQERSYTTKEKIFGTFRVYFLLLLRLVCDPADIIGRITLVRARFREIVLGCVGSDEVWLYF